MRRKIFLPLGIMSALVAVVAVWWGLAPRELNASATSLAVFNVENLTCGSCVRNIENALRDVDGIDRVEVSVTSGRSQVEFDQQRIKAVEIARRISAAGYPASIRETLSDAEYRALKDENGRLGSVYVARIGSRLVPRQEFDDQLRLRQAGLPQPIAPDMLDRLRLDVWKSLLQREMLLGAAEVKGVVVQEIEVEQEIEKSRAAFPGFEQMVVQRFGDIQAFRRQLKNDLIIRRHLDSNVAPDHLSEPQRRLALQQWYQHLIDNTDVVIFDPEIKAAASAKGSGCGGSCCG